MCSDVFNLHVVYPIFKFIDHQILDPYHHVIHLKVETCLNIEYDEIRKILDECLEILAYMSRKIKIVLKHYCNIENSCIDIANRIV